jgi:glycosyltransferase involved in cell wall biosynthesis
MKVALVHDWLTGMRGGENVLEIFCEMFPQADLYTLIHVKGSVSKTIEERTIHTSFLQRIPGIEKKYRWFLPLMPTAIGSFRLEGYDLVLSSSHCVAKGVNPGGAPHLCYCFTPMRYAWDMYPDYFNRRRFSPVTLAGIGVVTPYLRRWDVSSRVDRFIGISNHVRERIKRHYGRDAEVIYPPVDVDFYTPGRVGEAKEGYVVISAFAPYKRVDLAVEAFNKMGKPLHIVGGGEDDGRLKSAAGPSITFESGASRERLRELYRKSSALIFPGEEDFGIVPVEAMACGTPVIAYGKGGAMETVVPLGGGENPTGVFFENQTVEGLIEAVRRFEAERREFHTDALRKNAERFSKAVFVQRISTAVSDFLKTPQGGRRTGGGGGGYPSAVKRFVSIFCSSSSRLDPSFRHPIRSRRTPTCPTSRCRRCP